MPGLFGGVLSGLRVLDLSRILAGPWASQILADLGAEVVKVERPDIGDDTRTWGPPYLSDSEGRETKESAYFLSANRGKKSVTVDISKPGGQDLLRKLAAQSDIFIENYKIGDMARYGLDYPALKDINPRIIYCSISGFGQDGPLSQMAGYDFVIQAMGGLMSITGERDDLPGGGPQKVGVAFADLATGLYATIAIVSAIAHRFRSGEGQYIDMSLLDVQVATLANMNMNYLVSGKTPKRHGNAHANIVPYQVFPSADGHIVLAVGNDGQFARLCEHIGAPALALDERFATNGARVRNRDQLVLLLGSLLLQRGTEQWMAVLEPAGVPCGPINDIAQAFENPQVKHRGMRIDLPHAIAGSVPGVANPIKFSETPIAYHDGPPTLGQHTDEVLSSLCGLSNDEIEALRRNKII